MVELVTIGADSMEPSLLYKWISEGELPNLEVEMEKGAHGTATISSKSSIVQWSTHFTGVSADKHGVNAWTKTGNHPKEEDNLIRNLVDSSNIKVKTYPEILDEAEYSVGLLNPIPFYPPLNLENGVCVSGLLTPPSVNKWGHPPSVQDELSDFNYEIDIRYGNRPYGFIDDEVMDEVSLEEVYDDTLSILNSRIKTTKYLLKTYDFDYFYALYKSIDLVHHFFWVQMAEGAKYGDIIKKAYKRIDDLVGWLRNKYPGTSILTMSDHGAQTTTVPSLYGLYVNVDKLAESIPSPVSYVPRTIRRILSKYQRDMTLQDFNKHPRLQGHHNDKASWILSGGSIEKRSRSEIQFEDLTPTILSILENPVPKEYVGNVLNCVSPSAREPIDLSIDRGPEVEKVISERLYNLGYADMVDEN